MFIDILTGFFFWLLTGVLYCRYCTRSRLVSNAQGYGFHPQIDEGLSYIRDNSSIRDVLISGGDPLLLSDDKLAHILSSLHNIDHVEFVRIGSRVPVFMPQRITPSLLNVFSDSPNLWISLHINHPHECTSNLREISAKLAKSGIPLGNQSVLLKGINDDLEIMKSLVHRLLMMKIKPYYLYQCDLIKGSSHLRTDVSKGIRNNKGVKRSYIWICYSSICYRFSQMEEVKFPFSKLYYVPKRWNNCFK